MSGLADAAIKIAAWHGLVFRRAEGDGFRLAALDEESAELPVTTRQQDATEASEVGRDVLPGVHESLLPVKFRGRLGGHEPSSRSNPIGTTPTLQQFFPQFEESFARGVRKSSIDRFRGIGFEPQRHRGCGGRQEKI